MTSFYSYLFVALHNYVTSEIYFKICILWNILVPGGAGSAGQGTQAGQGGQIGPSGQGGTLVDGQGTYVGPGLGVQIGQSRLSGNNVGRFTSAPSSSAKSVNGSIAGKI